ncbi:transposase [Orientia tsutsugamushi]|uniref:transposase n=1 Tax=Orientia tsutsugamushi TaxID=784 RepID=UPI000D55893B|nr:transposase [Orientia tsutsugamushi]
MHPLKRTNFIGALVDNFLLTVFDCNVNTAIFNCWIKHDLILKLPNNSVVVIDNASFHKSQYLKTMIKKDRHI